MIERTHFEFTVSGDTQEKIQTIAKVEAKRFLGVESDDDFAEKVSEMVVNSEGETVVNQTNAGETIHFVTTYTATVYVKVK